MIESLMIDSLATLRLTRLVTRDKIAEPLRETWIQEAYYAMGGRDRPRVGLTWQDTATLDHDPPKAAQFITCPWCTSFWIALVVVAARRWAPRAWNPIARSLAFSHLAGLAANLDVD